MDLNELYRQYIGKNTLNFFRQDHGYKEGTYIKVWHGKEDNEVLANLVNVLDVSAEDFQELQHRRGDVEDQPRVPHPSQARRVDAQGGVQQSPCHG